MFFFNNIISDSVIDRINLNNTIYITDNLVKSAALGAQRQMHLEDINILRR